MYARAGQVWDKHANFTDFVRNTCLVFRERVRRGLLNTTRARRSYKQLFADFAFLMNEAHFVDEEMKLGPYEKVDFDSMVCTGLSISAQVQASIDYMRKGFELELYCVGELALYCSYMRHIYDFFNGNRQMHLQSLAGGRDLAQQLLNLHDLKNSSDKFNGIRRALNGTQKMAVDEFEVSRAMQQIFRGMEVLCTVLVELGVIKDVYAQYEEDAEDDDVQFQPVLGLPDCPVDSSQTTLIRENSYQQRLAYMKQLAYPRMKSFQEYRQDW